LAWPGPPCSDNLKAELAPVRSAQGIEGQITDQLILTNEQTRIGCNASCAGSSIHPPDEDGQTQPVWLGLARLALTVRRTQEM